MTKEALKMALEALELSHPRFGIGTAIYIKAMNAIKEALAQQDSKDKEQAKTDSFVRQLDEALAQPEPDWRALVLNHNADCDARCDMDRCGYKPYYEYNGRRCPDCPVYDKIEATHGIKEQL